MKITLAVEPVRAPLTGIGRYTWELASRLPEKLGPEAVKLIAHGQWTTIEQLTAQLENKPTFGRKSLIKRIKSIDKRMLMKMPFASLAYRMLLPVLNKTRLSTIDYDLYHGPNYYVPKIDKTSVVTIHDLSTIVNSDWHPAERIKRINEPLPSTIENASLVLTDSIAIREEVIQTFSLSESKVMAIPLGIDPNFTPRSEEVIRPYLNSYKLRPNGYSLCVATIEPRKNIERLIDAYQALPTSYKEQWPLVLIGEPGWNSTDLHQKIQKVAQAGWLNYLGFVPAAHLPMLYSGARLFIYPSFYEGFGLPVAEAMASGVPVITSNRSSLPEVANGAAWLINPDDTQELIDAIMPCLEDENWRSRAIASGLARAKELNWDTCVNQTLEAYRIALNNG